MIPNIIIRPLSEDESMILENLLYETIFQPEGAIPLPRKTIKEPQIWAYIDHFGTKKDDTCFVADLNGKIIGAVWVRILADEIRGYGNIDSETPEFAISLFPQYRNKGIGTMLMKKMISHLQGTGYKQTSLSVDKNNFATQMYQKLGFNIIQENEYDYLMLLIL